MIAFYNPTLEADIQASGSEMIKELHIQTNKGRGFKRICCADCKNKPVFWLDEFIFTYEECVGKDADWFCANFEQKEDV